MRFSWAMLVSGRVVEQAFNWSSCPVNSSWLEFCWFSIQVSQGERYFQQTLVTQTQQIRGVLWMDDRYFYHHPKCWICTQICCCLLYKQPQIEAEKKKQMGSLKTFLDSKNARKNTEIPTRLWRPPWHGALPHQALVAPGYTVDGWNPGKLTSWGW